MTSGKPGRGSSRRWFATAARRFAADSSGATVVEYALLTFIILGVLLVVAPLVTKLNGIFQQLTSYFGG